MLTVVPEVVGDECTDCDGLLVPGEYKGKDAAVCGSCGTPHVRLLAPPEVTVVLPTFNEADLILDAITAVLTFLDDKNIEIVVVDDGSTDGTRERVREVWEDEPRVRIIHRPDGDDLCSAILRGFDEAKADTAVVMDADLQHEPEKLPDLVDAVEGDADLAVGTRRADGGRVAGDWPRRRRVISRGADALCRLAVPGTRGLSDPMSGFFAVDLALLDGHEAEIHGRGYKALVELCAACEPGEVAEVGYEFSDREKGHSNLDAGEYRRFLVHIISTRLRYASRPTDLARSILWACIVAACTAVVAVFAVSFLTAVIPLVLGGVLWHFAHLLESVDQ